MEEKVERRKVLLLSYGTRGDVQPYIAVGHGLQRAGHRVMLGTSVRFQQFVEDQGLEYGYLNDDLLSIVDTPEGKALLETGGNFVAMAKQGLKVARMVKPAQQALMQESWDIAAAFGPDLILYHPKTAAAPHLAEKLDIPAVLLALFPMQVPTAERPLLVFPQLPLGGWYNRWTYRLAAYLTNKTLHGYIGQLRETMGLSELEQYDSLKMADGRNVPVFHLLSEAIVPRPADWPETAHVTGYCFMDSTSSWTPSPELTEFLAAGPPPVYVGFGSMAGRNPERLARVVLTALQRAGLRGILAKGWGGLQTSDLPDTVLEIDQAPHDWLLPQTAAVVHHGGAGTTAAGLRAGKPSVIVPFFGDQPFWGRRIHELGAGPKPLPQKRLSADRLAEALKRATSDASMIATADHLGQQLRGEHGVQQLIAELQKLQLL